MAAPKINMRRKMAVILALILLFFAAIVVKLFILQFIQGNTLQQRAEETRTRQQTVSAARGTIYDVNGNKLAISITADSIAARPAVVKEAEKENNQPASETARVLAELLGGDEVDIYEKITSDSSFVWIERKVDFEVAEMIQFENLPGITVVEETQRFYPRTTLAAHVLGFAGVDNQGLEGVELSLENWLQGTDGSIVGKYDGEERPLPQEEETYIPPEDGNNVYLTIDENIQYFCERELLALMESETPPKQAGIIIMRPDTCEILAMACTDPFDPNDYQAYDSSTWRNFLVSDAYEPGSTFKIITAAVALEEGTIDESSTFYDPGYISVADAQIHCWASVAHGSQTLAEAVGNSCNPAFVAIEQSIEAKESGLFYKYIEAFGFGQTTGIALNGEATGLLQSESARGPVEMATTAIGQGISVTPLQMITAACAVANGGYLMQPQIVSKVMDSEDQTVIYEQEPVVVRQVISEDTAARLRALLVNVVTDGGGANAAIEGYTIGGKTGTAQKPEAGGYADGKYVASFIGMVPIEDPELVCLVVVDEPSGVYYGSQVAAPVFKAVVSDTLRYLGIAPSADADDGIEADDTESIQVQVPNVVNLDLESAVAMLESVGLEVSLEGDGQLVTSQVPSSLTFVESGSTVQLYTGGVTTNDAGITYVTVPRLTGKRFAEAANLLSAMGLSMSPQGSGIAYSQSPAAGSVVESGAIITVQFQEESQVIQGVD